MAFFLLGEALLQLLHDRLPAAELGDPFLVFLAQIERCDAAQPVFRDFGLKGFGGQLEPLEDVPEDLIETVEVALVLHEARAGEIIEILDAISGDAGADGFKQRQVLFQRHRDFGGAQLCEECLEHGHELRTYGRI